MIVWNVTKFTNVRLSTFFKVVLVRLMSRSQNPLNQGARFGTNLHVTPILCRASLSCVSRKILVSSSAAARYVEALSDIMTLGRDLWLLNLLNAWRNVSTVKSVTISRCMARLTPHVNRQTYTLFSLVPSCMYSAAIKSTPVTSNGAVF